MKGGFANSIEYIGASVPQVVTALREAVEAVSVHKCIRSAWACTVHVTSAAIQRSRAMVITLRHANITSRLPSFRTLGWGTLLAILVSGPFLRDRYHQHPMVVSVRHKIRKVAKRSPLQLPLAGALAWVSLRAAHRLGFTHVVEVTALAAVINYVVRQEQKRSSSIRLEIQQLMQSPEACFAMLGERVPRWVSFPNVQRATWLNTVMLGLWPYVCEATQSVVKEKLAVTLANSKPVFLTSLQLVNFTLGSAPICVEGIQHHSMENKDTVLDMHLSWRSEGFEVRFAAAMSPLAVVEAAVTDFTFHFVVRIVLGPHLNHFPCVGAASVSILGAPDISFKLKAAKLSLDIIPGLTQWVDDFIRKVLVAKMVYPRQIVVPIAKDFDATTQASAFDHRAKALGRLRITVHETSGYTTGLLEANCYHVEVGVVDSPEANQKSAAHSEHNGVCDFADQKFTMTVHDNTSVVGFWLFRDDLQRTKLIGQRTFTMSELMEREKVGITLPLLHPKGKDCPAKMKLSTKFSAFATAGGDRTSTQRSGTFDNGEDGRHGADSPPRQPPRRSTSNVHSSLLPPVHRHSSSIACTPRQGSASGTTSGLLLIRVENCKNLRNFEMVGLSDPYVVLSVGNKTVKTPVVANCLDPVFNFDAEMDVEDAIHAVMEIKVFDDNVTKDVLMGKTTIALMDVIRSKGQLAKETRNLTPQGTITVTLTLRMEG